MAQLIFIKTITISSYEKQTGKRDSSVGGLEVLFTEKCLVNKTVRTVTASWGCCFMPQYEVIRNVNKAQACQNLQTPSSEYSVKLLQLLSLCKASISPYSQLCTPSFSQILHIPDPNPKGPCSSHTLWLYKESISHPLGFSQGPQTSTKSPCSKLLEPWL